MKVFDENKFVSSLFPKGLTDKVRVMRLNFNAKNNLDISVHIDEKPDIDVKKWGEWGVDYNSIILEGFFCDVNKAMINNWTPLNEGIFSLKKEDGFFIFDFKSDTGNFYIVFEHIIFQKAHVYLMD